MGVLPSPAPEHSHPDFGGITHARTCARPERFTPSNLVPHVRSLVWARCDSGEDRCTARASRGRIASQGAPTVL